MKWCVTKLVYRIICGEGKHTPQFDEQLRLFRATSIEEVLCKARESGKAEAVSFPNHQNQLVEWRFIDVADLYELPEVMDGAELYSRIEERDNPASYEAYVRHKAAQIAAQSTTLQPT